MADDKTSLLDQLLQDSEHHARVAAKEAAKEAARPKVTAQAADAAMDKLAAAARAAAPKFPAPEPKEAVVRRDPKALDSAPVETQRVRWSADPDVKPDLCGMKEGDLFEFKDCGKELDGPWRIVNLNMVHASAHGRFLQAERPDAKGPPYIKISEADVEDEIHQGRLIKS